MDQFNRLLDELDGFLNTHYIARGNPPLKLAELKGAVGGYVKHTDPVLDLSGELGACARSFVTTDSYNIVAPRQLPKLEQSVVRLRQQGTRYDGSLGDNVIRLPTLLAQPVPAQGPAFILRETAEQSRYLVNEAEEALAAEMSLSGASAWSKLPGTVSSQLSLRFEREGRPDLPPMAAPQKVSWHDPDAGVRQRAFEAELAGRESVRKPLAACLNSVGARRTRSIAGAVGPARSTRRSISLASIALPSTLCWAPRAPLSRSSAASCGPKPPAWVAPGCLGGICWAGRAVRCP